MLSLVKNEINGIPVELKVEETYSSKVLGGQPIFQVNNDFSIVYAVDTLTVIKAIATSTTIGEFKKQVKGTWTCDGLVELLEKESTKDKWVWFTIGERGDQAPATITGVIKADFNEDTLLIEDYDENSHNWKTVYKNADEVALLHPPEILRFFKEEPTRVAIALKNAYEHKDSWVLDSYGVWITGVFDMGKTNEYGLAENEWEI